MKKKKPDRIRSEIWRLQQQQGINIYKRKKSSASGGLGGGGGNDDDDSLLRNNPSLE